MTSDSEFRTVAMRKLAICFPATRQWLDGLESPNETIDQWEQELAEYSSDELAAAIEAIHRRDCDGPEAYERELWPVFISYAIKQAREARAKIRDFNDQHFEFVDAFRIKSGFSVLDAFKAVGDGKINARDLWRDEPDDRRDAVKCQRCRDLGSLEIFDIRTMQHARQFVRAQREFEDIRWLTSWIQCSCERGTDTWPHKVKGKIVHKSIPRFDPRIYTPARDGRDALIKWAEEYRPPSEAELFARGE